MRVVGGDLGGRRLLGPPSEATRPTSDRVREATFNALGSMQAVADRRVLDLFAGTGAMGIEALSRGSRWATFVEQDPDAVTVLEANRAELGLAACSEVVRSDAVIFEPSGPFGLIIVDPPYSFGGWEALLSGLVGASEPDAVVVAESDRTVEASGWAAVRTKAYGGTVVTLLRRRASKPPAVRPASDNHTDLPDRDRARRGGRPDS